MDTTMATRFQLPEEKEEMMEHLQEHGYAVVANVADEESIEKGKDLFWKFVQGLNDKTKEKEKRFQIERGDPSTWGDSSWFGNPVTGIISDFCFPQSEFCWFSRLLPGVEGAFSAIWGNDLVVSFDGGNAFRPWRYNKEFLTNGGWWHVDQNSYQRPEKQGRVCVQGLLTYFDANEESGGLCVIPKSHLKHDELCSRIQTPAGDFVSIPKDDPLLSDPELEKKYVFCKAGDLVLWDSRTVHCNSPSPLSVKDLGGGEGEGEKEGKWDLIRLVSYVCMLPKSTCSNEILRRRIELFEQGGSTTHWPSAVMSPPTNPHFFDPPTEVTAKMRQLVGYDTGVFSDSHPNFSLPLFGGEKEERGELEKEDVELYEKDRAFVLSSLLGQKECDWLIKEGERIGIPPLDYSTGYKIEYRNNDRVIIQSEELAKEMWGRVQKLFQKITITAENKFSFGNTHNMEGVWEPVGLNPVFRLCRYHPGGHFAPHYDGHYLESSGYRSLKTFMMYLNGNFDGGSTNWVDESQTLYKDELKGFFCAEKKNILGGVKPQPGRALVFDHHILHEGEELQNGMKYILRSEVMYRQTSKRELNPLEEQAMKFIEMAAAAEENKEAMKAMEFYRRAFKLWPPLENVYT